MANYYPPPLTTGVTTDGSGNARTFSGSPFANTSPTDQAIINELFGWPTAPRAAFYQELIVNQGAWAYWPMTEPASAATLTDVVGGRVAINSGVSAVDAVRTPAIKDIGAHSLSTPGPTFGVAVWNAPVGGDTTMLDFSVTAWGNYQRLDSTNNGMVTIYDRAGSVRAMRFLPRRGNGGSSAFCGIFNSASELANQPTNAGENLSTWVHWGATRAANVWTLYRNGISINNRTDLPAATTVSVGSVNMGADTATGGNPALGNTGQVAIFARALTAAEVLAQYNAGINGF